MKRREFIAGLSAALAAPIALAQKVGRPLTLGVLNPHPIETPEQWMRSPIRARLVQLGWKPGESLVLDRPDGEGREDRLPAMAEALARKQVDAIWAIGPEAAVAAARATKQIPIVFWGVAYPVEQGLVDSLARPGGNVTGIAFVTGTELAAKLIEYLKMVAPAARRVSMIGTPTAVTSVKGERFLGSRSVIQEAARQLGLEVRAHDIVSADDIDRVLGAILEDRPQALVVPGTTLTFRERRRFIAFANANGIPSVFNQREFVEAGGLLSYGPDSWATVLQTLDYVDRILRGAKPADLPVELPSKYEFAINMRTARALGINVPQIALLRADRVIE